MLVIVSNERTNDVWFYVLCVVLCGNFSTFRMTLQGALPCLDLIGTDMTYARIFFLNMEYLRKLDSSRVAKVLKREILTCYNSYDTISIVGQNMTLFAIPLLQSIVNGYRITIYSMQYYNLLVVQQYIAMQICCFFFLLLVCWLVHISSIHIISIKKVLSINISTDQGEWYRHS